MADAAGRRPTALEQILADLDDADAAWEAACDAAGLSPERRELVLLLSEVQTLRHELADVSALCEQRTGDVRANREEDAAYTEVDYALTAVLRATAVVQGEQSDQLLDHDGGPIDARPLHRDPLHQDPPAPVARAADAEQFGVMQNADGTQRSIGCRVCFTSVVDLQLGDNLAAIVRAVADHVCPPARRPRATNSGSGR